MTPLSPTKWTNRILFNICFGALSKNLSTNLNYILRFHNVHFSPYNQTYMSSFSCSLVLNLARARHGLGFRVQSCCNRSSACLVQTISEVAPKETGSVHNDDHIMDWIDGQTDSWT